MLHEEAHGSFVLSWCVIMWGKNDSRPMCSLQLEYTQLISNNWNKKGHQNPQSPITPSIQCLWAELMEVVTDKELRNEQ